jgi:hypothetical protein
LDGLSLPAFTIEVDEMLFRAIVLRLFETGVLTAFAAWAVNAVKLKTDSNNSFGLMVNNITCAQLSDYDPNVGLTLTEYSPV